MFKWILNWRASSLEAKCHVGGSNSKSTHESCISFLNQKITPRLCSLFLVLASSKHYKMVNYHQSRILITFNMQNYSPNTGSELVLAFCSKLIQLATQVPRPHLQKVLPCMHPCHTWNLGLGTPWKVVSPNFRALNGWDCTDLPQVTWALGLGSPCEPAYECAFTSAGGTKMEMKSAKGIGWRSADATSVAAHALMALLLSWTHVSHLMSIISPRSSSTLPI
jgi:hypothetical protein